MLSDLIPIKHRDLKDDKYKGHYDLFTITSFNKEGVPKSYFIPAVSQMQCISRMSTVGEKFKEVTGIDYTPHNNMTMFGKIFLVHKELEKYEKLKEEMYSGSSEDLYPIYLLSTYPESFIHLHEFLKPTEEVIDKYLSLLSHSSVEDYMTCADLVKIKDFL